MTTPEPQWKRHADALLGVVASAILFAMMALTVVDVVARYVFSRPLRGAFEITELLLLALIFAGLAAVLGCSTRRALSVSDTFTLSWQKTPDL